MEYKDGVIYFNNIYVIESLYKEDRKTGTELYEDVITRRSWQKPNLSTRLIQIESKKDLFETLFNIKDQCSSKNNHPFIHFETHGFSKGISLKNKENIYWSEITPILREINISTKNNLFISVAACLGGSIQHEIKISEPCPFRGFIGPIEKVLGENLVISYSTFFNELLVSNNFDSAIQKLNEGNFSNVKYEYMTSELFFDVIMKNHLKELEQKSFLFDSIVSTITNRHWNNNTVVQKQFRTKGMFQKLVHDLLVNDLPFLIEVLKNRFLHVI